jgi:low affinity Fe/Cu permease
MCQNPSDASIASERTSKGTVEKGGRKPYEIVNAFAWGGLMTNGFRRIADVTGSVVGSPWAFTANIALTTLWLLLGPVFQFSDTWQLTMNTAASQVTFLIAFLLQNTQNRDTRALQLKLDELIRSTAGARPQLIQLEALDDDQLDALKQEFERVRERRSRSTG